MLSNHWVFIIGIAVLVLLFLWGLKQPKQQLHGCRVCGRTDKLRRYEDSGHDYVEHCYACGARYGVQDSPFDIMIERLPDGDKEKLTDGL